MSDARDESFEQTIIANVREHGCHINYVSNPDDEMPVFAYSVGFPETIKQPEVIVFGLSLDVMQFMINETLHQCRRGLLLEDGLGLHGLLKGHRCCAREVVAENITREHFNSAMWFQRHLTGKRMERAFQIVWPGAQDGLFPWEEGCDDLVLGLQPCLGRKAAS